jgi:hypothetical protein
MIKTSTIIHHAIWIRVSKRSNETNNNEAIVTYKSGITNHVNENFGNVSKYFENRNDWILKIITRRVAEFVKKWAKRTYNKNSGINNHK